MRTTIEKVRLAVGLGAALLAIVVIAFLGFAHRRAHRLLRDLPARLGADIEKETNGFTYSQSFKGRTIYTIHAAKATQRKDGLTGLRDVGIVLYGDGNGLMDRIYGKDFEYDAKNGIVRALGEVQLDLQTPGGTRGGPQRAGAVISPRFRTTASEGVVHVTTSGLVYQQQLGLASTAQALRFEYSGLTGTARGASYNARTGLTILNQEVRLSELHDGRPAVLTAAHAEFDREGHRMTLRSAHYVALGKIENDRSTGETVSAETLVLHLGETAGIESADADGDVELRSDGSLIQAPRAVLQLREQGRPQVATLTGGVRFSSGDAAKQDTASSLQGRATGGVALFDAAGQLVSLHLTGDVQSASQSSRTAGRRSLSGQDMLLHFDGAPGGHRLIEQAAITGDATLKTLLPATVSSAETTEELRGDLLTAQWRALGKTAALSTVSGSGHTSLHRLDPAVDETSRGDQLEASFAPGPPGPHGRSGINASLSTAVQSGHVLIDRIPLTTKGGGQPADAARKLHASATHASYVAATGKITLSDAEMMQTGSALRADRVVLTESSGDAEATGSVQATYQQRPPLPRTGIAEPGAAAAGEPTHAIGVRALLHHDNGTVTFFGGSGTRARIWQAGSQIEAPVLVLDRNAGTMDAFGEAATEAMPVRAVLANAASTAPGSNPASKGGKATVLRVESGRLHYDQATNQARFSGGVLLRDGDGTMSSRDAIANLAPATKKAPASAPTRTTIPSSLGGALVRVVATTDVIIRQPERLARGQQAIYTASDGLFVLTGTPASPPTVTDATNGSTTGAALRFRAGDNSVTIDGDAQNGSPALSKERVHTRTRVKQ